MEVNQKKAKGFVIAIVVLTILVLALGGYIGYDKFLSKNVTETSTTEKNSKSETDVNNEIENSKNEENNKEDNQNEAIVSNSNKAKCYGTYYVNGNISDGVYILNKDGTYQVENQETFGVFTINENTITFIEKKHTTGPREEDPIYYNPKSYLISDDCTRIRLTESGSHVSAYLEKAN